jgi:hypothetical protein
VNLHVLIVDMLSGWNNKTGENLVWDLAVQSSFVQQLLLLKNSSTFKLLLVCVSVPQFHYSTS